MPGLENLPKAEMSAIAARSERNLRLYALCGVIAPIFFAFMLILEQSVVPGYNWISQYGSDLGNYAFYGSFAILQNLNFWIFGILVIAFTLGGLRRGLPGSRAVTITLGLSGAMFFMAGVFTDQPPPPGQHLTPHILAGDIGFPSITLCQIFVWKRLRHTTAEEESAWRRHRTYSLVSGLLTLLLGINFFYASGSNSAFVGLEQRAFIAVPLSWIEVMALKLFRLSKISKVPRLNERGSH